jgi:capsid protein
MARTLKQRLEVSEIKRQIVENEHRVKVLNFVNENLAISRKRKLGWTSPGKPDRDFSKADRRKASGMARQRVEESPVFQAILNARVNNVVGRGFRLMMRSGDSGWDTEVENWWALEKDRLDVAGLRTWGQLNRLWQARHDVCGDVGIAMLNDAYLDRPLSYLQTFEAEQITKNDAKDSNESGIDFDEFGMPVRYYVVSDPDDRNEKARAFDRENFILYKNDNTYRVNRARGVSLFLQAFAIGQDHADIMDGITQLVKAASFIGLKFRMDADETGNAFGTAGGDTTGENGVDYSKVKLLPGTNIVLGEGEDVDVLESKNPTEQVQSFEKILLSRILLPFGLTYELLTGDYSSLNDRTARVAQKQFEKVIRPDQDALGVMLSRIFRWTLSRTVNAGILTPPAGLKTWFNQSWGKPGFPYINILQEAQANVLLLEKGLTSRTKILGDQGDDDFDDLMDELKYEDDVIKAKGIQIAAVNGKPMAEPDDEIDPLTDKDSNIDD